MTKFNTTDKRIRNTSGPLTTNNTAPAHTYNGAAGYEYDTLSQLFLLACSNMVGENTFYEDAASRDGRYEKLIHQAVNEGHSQWLARFLPWLRNSANMRTASLIGGIEAAVAMLHRGIPGGRQIVNSVLVRADEPGEALAYLRERHAGVLPQPIKRGIADAATRLYTQRNALKYDTASHGFRFGDVLELCHAGPDKMGQGDLFKYLVTSGKGRADVQIPDSLDMILANKVLRAQAQTTPQVLLNTTRLSRAGMTWEAAKSLAGKTVSDKDFWRMMIPEMGYMALLRNLRNFDEAGLDGDMVHVVCAKLRDPEQVARSRQLPMRFLSAYRNVPSNRWAQALDEALELSLSSVPGLSGSTLILIDTSVSMTSPMSGKSQLQCKDAAQIFGLALAKRCQNPTVVTFSGTSREFPQVKGESLLRAIDRFDKGYFYGGGTATAEAVKRHYISHDRVIVLTDEQADPNSGIFTPVPASKMVVTFNLAGYKVAHAPTGPNRVAVGGLSDAAFTLLHSLDSRRGGMWPF